MAAYKEGNRYLYLTTPLGEDNLLLRGFSGQETISDLFTFQLDVLADLATQVDFDQLIGQKVSFGIQGVDAGQTARHFNGIVVELTQGGRDKDFTNYRMTVVPTLWLLSKREQSRIFQHITIPDVLKKVLTGLDVEYQIQGTFEQREYLVQYRESDLDFVSRLMEEEGIFYFFKFTRGAHKLVLANTPQSHPDVPGNSKLIYEEIHGGDREEERIDSWSKAQRFGSGKYTLWDHHFQLPHKHLEADRPVGESIAAGKVTHKLQLADNTKLEIYDFPGGYAQRFDGIDRGGGEKPADLQKIFQDNKRTVEIRMQQNEVPMLVIQGTSNHRQLTPGHKFTLQRHFNADGQYVVVSVVHSGSEGGFRSGKNADQHYGNSFTCIPIALKFRPQMETERPLINGPQSAVVVGPPGEEIFTDKYGRIKVQFHWDREGKNNADSSCWLRVATSWAGQNWGSIHIPRIDQEVIVSFLDGDPDRPLVTGCVYNPSQMPPYILPDKKTVSTLKSRSTMKGTKDNYNEFRFEDLKGKEQIYMHAERDLDVRVKSESREIIGGNRHMNVGVSQTENVGKNKTSVIAENYTLETGMNKTETIGINFAETVGAACEFTVGAFYTETVGAASSMTVGGSRSEAIGGDQSTAVGGDHHETCGGLYALDAGREIHLKGGMNVVIEAGMQLTLKAAGGFITIGPSGVAIQGTMVLINSGGAAGVGSGANPKKPKDKELKSEKAEKAVHADTGGVFDAGS